MKELTIEQKAKAYDEALVRAREWLETKNGYYTPKELCEEIFPELGESEDEKIRKDLIQFIKNWKDPTNIGRPHDFHTLTRNVEQCDRYIAWLEKQKEFVSADFDDVWETADCNELTAPLDKYSKDAIKEMCHAWYDKGIELERKGWLEKQGEQENLCDKCKKEHPSHSCQDITELGRCAVEHNQNPTDVEPKFQNGQWIVWQNKCYKVNYNGCGYELIDQMGLRTSLEYGTVDENAHLWSIQDAKDGDVLVASDGSVFIYAGSTDIHAKFYVALTECSRLNVEGGVWEDKDSVHPATKEQCNLLFQKMNEAGYNWMLIRKS